MYQEDDWYQTENSAGNHFQSIRAPHRIIQRGSREDQQRQKVPSEYENDPDLYWAIQASLQPNEETATADPVVKTPSTAENGSEVLNTSFDPPGVEQQMPVEQAVNPAERRQAEM